MIKICHYKSGTGQGENLVQVFEPGNLRAAEEFFSMGKIAAPMLPEVQQYLSRLKKDPNKIYVLVNALGAGEYWGSNINGDYFPEAALVHKGRDWGYETFYDAHAFAHHRNKNPEESFGTVELAVWHDGMKRVELVVAIDRVRARQFGAEGVVDKLDQGLYPDVSMGCKVPFDLCSICTDWKSYRRAQATFDPRVHRNVGQAVLAWHKKSPIKGLSVTRNDYCEHLQHSLNKILPDGKKVYAINDYPRFFDISFVFIGADKTAKVLAKLASVEGVSSALVAEELGISDVDTEKCRGKSMVGWSPKIEGGLCKQASVARMKGVLAKMAALKRAALKRAEITKQVIPSQFGGKAITASGSSLLPEGSECTPDLPNEVLDLLGQCPFHDALSTPTSMGIVLRPREFQRIVIIRIGNKPLADTLDSYGRVFCPTEEVSPLPLLGSSFSESIMRLLLPFLEDRSILEPVVRRRVLRIVISGQPIPEEPLEPTTGPLMQKIAAAYNGYLQGLEACFDATPRLLSTHADLWGAVFQESLASSFDKTASAREVAIFGPLGAILLHNQLAEYYKT